MILETKRLAILETEHLRLTPLVEADATHVFSLMDDPEVMACWDASEIDDPDIMGEIVRGQIGEMARGSAIYWAIRPIAADQLAGVCELSEIDRRHKRAEIAFMLGRKASGQRYALEAMQAVVAFAAASGLRRLAARSQLGNRPAEAVLAQLGFQQQGLLRGHAPRDGERRDCRLFGLLL